VDSSTGDGDEGESISDKTSLGSFVDSGTKIKQKVRIVPYSVTVRCFNKPVKKGLVFFAEHKFNTKAKI